MSIFLKINIKWHLNKKNVVNDLVNFYHGIQYITVIFRTSESKQWFFKANLKKASRCIYSGRSFNDDEST